jgi:hypothetical protein
MNNYRFLSIGIGIGMTLVFGSCKTNLLDSETDSDKKEVALSITQETQQFQYLENLLDSSNAEFLKGEYVQNFPISKITSLRSSSSEEDTITDASEMPIVKYEKLNQSIYTDGTYQIATEDITPDSMKFTKQQLSDPLADDERISKSVVKDNIVYLYNSKNELLASQEVEVLSYSGLLDSIQNESDTVTKAQTSITARKSRALMQAKTNGMTIVSEDESGIWVEMDLGTGASSVPGKLRSATTKKALMRFSPDMSQLYIQKNYEDNQLVESFEITYPDEEDTDYKNVVLRSTSLYTPTINVKKITHRKLQVSRQNSPQIVRIDKVYTKNQVIYNLKTK